MSLIVQKFGGTSVANTERLKNVADIITKTYEKGNDVVVVVSAQGDTTDEFIEKARQVNPNPSKREMDMLLTAGEQISFSFSNDHRRNGLSCDFFVRLAGRIFYKRK